MILPLSEARALTELVNSCVVNDISIHGALDCAVLIRTTQSKLPFEATFFANPQESMVFPWVVQSLANVALTPACLSCIHAQSAASEDGNEDYP